jgi:hypothetical protein
VNACWFCGVSNLEVAWSAVLERYACLDCYLTHAPASKPDHLHGCPRCGVRIGTVERRTGLYGAERICWPCYTAQYPQPRRRAAKRKPSDYEWLHERAWSRLEAVGTVFVMPGVGRLAGYCPVCANGTTVVTVVDADPPVVRAGGCTAGCSGSQLIEAMR